MSIERVTLTGSCYGQICQNVLHFSNPDGFQTPAQICIEMRDYFIGFLSGIYGIADMQSSSFLWQLVSVQTLATPPPLPTSLNIAAPGTRPTATGMFLPQCAVMQIRTAIAGRKGRGRFYVSGIEAVTLTSGLWNASMMTIVNPVISALNALYSPTGTSNLTLGVNPKGPDPSFTPMTQIQLAPIPGMQRRRNISYGI